MFKFLARKPVPKIKTYLRYGFIITESECQYCPRCGNILNAGPRYQPRYCDQCGQRVTFDGVRWKEEKELGHLPAWQRGDAQ